MMSLAAREDSLRIPHGFLLFTLLLALCVVFPVTAVGYSSSATASSTQYEEGIHVPWKPRPVLGGVKTVFLLVEFPDVRLESSLSDIEYFVDFTNAWFRTSSYGKMYIDYTIYDYVIQLPWPMAFYGLPEAGSQRGDSEGGLKMYYDNIIDLLDERTDLDLADFKDVVIIHAGGDEAVTSSPYDIWSHCLAYGPVSDELGENGLWVMGKDGNIQNLWGISTFSEKENPSIFIHEYCHSIGLPDLYIYGSDGYSESTAVSFWSNMDSGAFLDPPADIDGWGKYILGWVEPVVIDSPTGEYMLNTLESSQEPKALMIRIPDSHDEYYFIHARRRAGTDAALPSDGVLVFRIDVTREQSYAGAELAVMIDAHPGSLEKSAQYYTEEIAMHYELLDAPHNKNDETYVFSMGSLSAEFTLTNNFFWDRYAEIAFLVEHVDDDTFKVRFGSSPEELGVEIQPEDENGEPPSGCVIASAAYGSELSPDLQALRNFRDKLVLSTFAGGHFMNAFNMWYYSFSPEVAKSVSSSPTLRMIVRALIHPLVGILQVSMYAYEGLSFNRELGIISAGLVATSLIGAVYVAPWTTTVLYYATMRKGFVPHRRSLRPLVYAWIAAVVLIGVADVFYIETLMICATVTLVLLTLGLSSTVTAIFVIQKHKITATYQQP